MNDILLDPISLCLMGMFAGLMLWERLAPGRTLPTVRGWLPRALVAVTAYLMLSSYLPLLWADTLAPIQLFDLSGWPTAAASVCCVLVYELLAYAYHRSMHTFTPMWRLLHRCTTAPSGRTRPAHSGSARST